MKGREEGKKKGLYICYPNPAFRWVYLSFSSLPLASLLSSAICKASSDNHFAFLHFLFLGMVLITTSCTVLQTSVHSSSGTLSDLISGIYLSLPLYNHKGFGKHPLPTTQEKNSTHGHHQLVNTKID